ncbi:LexA family protein [Enterovirga aerilata]|uniref:Translesion error-prone DNA polymerase V autoproteolytic subunit n=1 Tax=Enterovirga aerilata TaxID=2730920 RepID=A0A849I290_9HYPH|nr:translesion error-prone DNA polymerase V autoproteolytic subunit [Enterovirga sp. DB1703]NNM73926.1 translesion error-prone DNA polymerase V autoproteolytic subunit [Enterovirga sp. DB1703]
MHIHAIIVGVRAPLPVLARAVKAGFPSPADDYVDRGIDLNELLIANRPATFLVKVDGDSMVQKGLCDGDLAVVDRSLDPREGDVVVVDVDGERSFKVWSTVAGRPKLSFANLRYPAFETSAFAEIEVWGVVCGSVNPRRRAIR